MADDNSGDLDAFLTMLETKLKPDFSSTEIPKAVNKTALRQIQPQYLERVAAVLSRAEKVTQLRVLTGLLGCDSELDEIIQRICASAQEAPLYEEWVRVVAGLVQAIMFSSSNDDDVSTMRDDDDLGEKEQEEEINTRSNSNIGMEARELLDKTCREIINRVRKLENGTNTIDEDTEYRLGQSDADPTLAPYRYALLNPELLQTVIPDIAQNDHFTVNTNADILQIDAALELEKAKEELEHRSRTAAVAAPTKAAATKTPVDFPGFKTKKSTTPTKRAAHKSSMFMPSKRPVAVGGGRGGRGAGGRSNLAVPGRGRGGAAAGTKRPLSKPSLKPVQGTVLKQRKKGAAQALLSKRGAARQRAAAAGANSTTDASAHKSRGGAEKSRMQVVDVAEVKDTLLQQVEHPHSLKKAPPPSSTADKKKSGVNKRSKPESVANAAAAKILEQPEKRQKTATNAHEDDKKPAAASAAAGVLANAALLAYQNAQQQQQQQQQQKTTPHKQQDWRDMLQQKSNRLSPEDRARIQQFFVHHHNPTPDQGSTYKIKLHEERTTDPKTGEPVKETFYLELDYNNFTSKQSKKIKRYKDGGGH